jgi:type I restriction-modification system DNA methylase subunit
MSTKMRETYKSFGDLDPGERQKKYYEAYKVLGEETENRVREVLLAHQLDRLRQIMLQMKLRGAGYGSASALSGDDVAGALGLTDEQKEQLRQKEQEVRAEMQAKTQEFYKKLREEGREKLLEVLTEAQRKKLQDLMGEKYEWQSARWQAGQGGAAGNVRIKQTPKQD